MNTATPLTALAIGAALLASVGAAAAATAAPQYTAQVSVSADNFATGGGSSFLITNGYDHPSDIAQANLQQSFQGLNSSGDWQAMTLTASGAAYAEPGGLHASSSVTLATPYYNAANPNYVGGDFTVNPAGSPASLSEFAVAQMNDTLSVSASQALYGLRLTVKLDGTVTDSKGYSVLTNSDASVFASSSASGGCNASQSDCAFADARGPGFYADLYSFDLAVTDASAVPLTLALSLNNIASLNYGGYSESADYGLTMDFSNTLDIVGLQGLDAEGNAVALSSVIGASGHVYPTTPVPEPAAAWLMLLGLAGLGTRRLARRSAG